MSAPYPWQARQWELLCSGHVRGTLAHAYLLCGREGLGKFQLADSFAQLVLCEAAGRSACGRCRGCTLYRSGNHPDIKLLQIEEDRKSIVVEQVRELIDFYALKAHFKGPKLALIHPADAMNTAAANALLKILEEPPASGLLLLVAHRPNLLPATVISRCQRVNFTLPSWPEREAWVQASLTREQARPDLASVTLHGAPLEIIEQLGSPEASLFDDLIDTLGDSAREFDVLATARRFAAIEVRRFIDALEAVVQATVVLRSGHLPVNLRLSRHRLEQLQEISNKLNCKRLFLYLDVIAQARTSVLRSSGVRGAEVIENLWFGWARAMHVENAV